MTHVKEATVRGDGVPAKPEGASVTVPPKLEARDISVAKESGYARAARLRSVGTVAVAATRVNHTNDDEPHEDVGFGD